MSHYGITPAQICDAIITELSRFKVTPGGTGKVKTIKRLAGELADEDKLNHLLTSGTPAFLVAYMGGKFAPLDTAGYNYKNERNFAVVCCAGSYESEEKRFENSLDGTPGVEQLLDWATYYVMQCLLNRADDANPHRLGGLVKFPRPTQHKQLLHSVGKYVYSLEFSCMVAVDFEDETPAATLQSVGIVHDPLDYDELFLEEDNETPNTDNPPAIAGGVFDL